jgi:hypothetical protein
MCKAPLRLPVAVGSKVTLMLQLCPTLRISDVALQVSVSLKSPVVVMLAISRVVVPVLVMVTVWAELTVPTV